MLVSTSGSGMLVSMVGIIVDSVGMVVGAVGRVAGVVGLVVGSVVGAVVGTVAGLVAVVSVGIGSFLLPQAANPKHKVITEITAIIFFIIPP